jgi:hypothetical protein
MTLEEAIMVRPKKRPLSKHYIVTRGKVHLSNQHREGYTYCGIDLGDVNNYTLDIQDTTCQKCLMVQTGTWGGRDRGKIC